jgi:serine/threonine protein kinase
MPKNVIISGRYKPTGATSTGGMGEIIYCTDLHLKRSVVLKQLQSDIEERRLIDEQKALLKLRSKHVVQLYDIIDMGIGFDLKRTLVLEFIEGTDLRPGTFSADSDYLKTLWQIACGLTDIHAAGIIHRDIKPNNIRIDKESVAKIIDFGLARHHEEAKTQNVVGTPIFMAPELWSDKTVHFSAAIDVYAFGVTALSLLKEDPPIELQERPPKPVSTKALHGILKDIPSDIISAIGKCVDVNPTNRPKMSEVKNLLERYLLKDKHRALVVMNGKPHHLDHSRRVIKLSSTTVGSLTIQYNGFDFVVSESTGLIYINNVHAISGFIVPGCCVITFGAGANRRFVTFDTSNPEVMS